MKKFKSSSLFESKVRFSYQGAKSNFLVQFNLKLVISISIILTGLGIGWSKLNNTVETVVVQYPPCINYSNTTHNVKVIINNSQEFNKVYQQSLNNSVP